MTIKDFKAGHTAYIIGDKRRGDSGMATAVEVIKVGRRYVTVKEAGRQKTRFYEAIGFTDCLAEDREYGAKRLLFATAEAVDEYNELNSLRDWVQEAANWTKVKTYTIAQLQAVKKILEDTGYGKET